MSIRKFLTIASLSCMLPLVACEDSDPKVDDNDDDLEEDAPDWLDEDDDDAKTDGGLSRPDAGASSDAGKTSDGGVQSAQGAKLFLPTGEPNNTSEPTVEVDAAGNTHTVYPAYVRGGAYYAFCSAGKCTSQADMQVVKFDTDGTVGNAMIALTSDGKPRILLSSYMKVYYGSCDSGCGQRANWKFAEILNHNSEREITGEAFALDPQGHPRFVMHTYRAFLGIGQKAPKTYYAQCDAGCETGSNWRFDDELDSSSMFVGSTLRFDAQGKAHLATAVINSEKGNVFAYYRCDQSCTSGDNWIGVGLGQTPYESEVEVAKIKPTISLALTKTAKARVVLLAKAQDGKKNIVYFESGADTLKGSDWQGSIISEHDRINAGLDLALDQNDQPRFVYTLDYNIALAYCDAAQCAGENSRWDLTLVERSTDIPADRIFLEWNCTIGAWMMHDPSLALTKEGAPRIGYQTRDISGGFSQPDTTKPRCVAGTDMTWSRLAVLPSYR